MAEKKGAGGKPQEYDEESGRYESNGGAKEYRQNASYSEIINIGKKQSGAIDEDKEPKRATEHARKMYETYRRRASDIPKIAKVTGHTEEEITRVKNHMFINEHDLDDGRHRFDPDFQQAQSWIRLESGKPEEHDLVMIEHELIEEQLMRENGLSYDEAHAKTNQVANYQKALWRYKDALAKKKGN